MRTCRHLASPLTICIPKQKYSPEGHCHDTRKQYPMIVWPLIPLCMFIINLIINLLYCKGCLEWIAWLSNTKLMVVLLREFTSVVESVCLCLCAFMFVCVCWLDCNQSFPVITSCSTLTLCCSVVCKIVRVSVSAAYTKKICGLLRKSSTKQQKHACCFLCEVNYVVGLWDLNSKVKN